MQIINMSIQKVHVFGMGGYSDWFMRSMLQLTQQNSTFALFMSGEHDSDLIRAQDCQGKSCF